MTSSSQYEFIKDIILEKYSEKSFILKGNTIQYKQDIKQLGGSWNPSLKAWIFPISKMEVIEKWLDKGEKTVEPIKQYFESPVVETCNRKKEEHTNLNDRIDVLEKKLDSILDMLNKICIKDAPKSEETRERFNLSLEKVKPRNQKDTDSCEDYVFEEEIEEPVIPRKRLLRN